jgi:DHA3 family macrolide efflux protein-like MFS transporter
MGSPFHDSPLREPRFRRLWAGQGVSSLGNALTEFALGVWVFQQTGSATLFGASLVAVMLPMALAAPVAGALVDRWDRRRALLGSEGLLAVTTLLLAVLAATGRLGIGSALALLAVRGVLASFQGPAVSSTAPRLLPGEALSRAVGLVQLSMSFARIAGPLLGSWLFAHVGLRGVLSVDGLSFVCSLTLLLGLRVPAGAPRPVDARRSLRADVAAGWRVVRQSPVLRALVLFYGAQNLCMGFFAVALTPMILGFTDSARLGRLQAIGAAGMVGGALLMSMWRGPRRRIHGVFAASAIMGSAMLLVASRPSAAAVGVGLCALLFSFPIVTANAGALLQTIVPPSFHGRVFAVLTACGMGTTPLAVLVGGPLVDRVLSPALSAGGALSPTAGALLGVGPGRGAALLILAAGLALLAVTAACVATRAIRHADGATLDGESLAATPPSTPAPRRVPSSVPEPAIAG